LTIDTHHHFWHYDAAELGWIADEMTSIRRDWLPADLRPAMVSAAIDRVITVEARASVERTRWLLTVADQHPEWIAGVVGWLPIAADDFPAVLDANRHPKLVALRHAVQGQPPGFFDRPDFDRGIATLCASGLAYDVLIYAPQLPEVGPFVDRHPTGRFVVNHLAKPFVERGELEPWRTHLRELARRPNVWCKLSGGITERDLAWTPASIRPYLDAALEAFGPRRVMFGSNWPLSEPAGGIALWTNFMRDWATALAPDEHDGLFAQNAIDFYRLAP